MPIKGHATMYRYATALAYKDLEFLIASLPGLRHETFPKNNWKIHSRQFPVTIV